MTAIKIGTLSEDQAILGAVHDELLKALLSEPHLKELTHFCSIEIHNHHPQQVETIVTSRLSQMALLRTLPRAISRDGLAEQMPQMLGFLEAQQSGEVESFIIEQCTSDDHCRTTNPAGDYTFALHEAVLPELIKLSIPYEYTLTILDHLREGCSTSEDAFRLGARCALYADKTGISIRTVFDLAVFELKQRDMLTPEQDAFCGELISQLWGSPPRSAQGLHR